MPWKVTDVVDERTRLFWSMRAEASQLAELCRIYGIARGDRLRVDRSV